MKKTKNNTNENNAKQIYSNQIQLVNAVKNNNDINAFKELKLFYQKLIYKTVFFIKSIYKNIPLQIDDLLQEADKIFYNLILEYDEKYNKNLSSYFQDFIKYKLNSICKKFTSKNNCVLNYASPYIEDYTLNENEEEYEEEKSIQLIKLENIIKTEMSFLSSKEKLIIQMYLKYAEFDKISNELNMSISKVYSTFFRAKQKLQEKLK